MSEKIRNLSLAGVSGVRIAELAGLSRRGAQKQVSRLDLTPYLKGTRAPDVPVPGKSPRRTAGAGVRTHFCPLSFSLSCSDVLCFIYIYV